MYRLASKIVIHLPLKHTNPKIYQILKIHILQIILWIHPFYIYDKINGDIEFVEKISDRFSLANTMNDRFYLDL